MLGRPLYHWMDPVWTRVWAPSASSFSVERFGALQVIRMARSYRAKELPAVYCYAVGDTLVDTGLACGGDALAAFAARAGIRRAVLTHHHEDHAGNAGRLSAEGVEVLAGARTATLVGRDLPIRFYQHVLWGKAPSARAGALAETVRIGPYEARIVAAPGHCDDQVVFHVPEQGWLFSGDVFIHERVKVFRRDEDFSATLATLERLLALDFEVLFCAHRPRFQGGKAALAAKLGWLRDIEGRVRDLHRHGAAPAEIARRLGIPRPASIMRLALGDVSTANMVESILHGPRPRVELAT